jgi:hypothetical protein
MKANLAADRDQSSNRRFASMDEKKQKEMPAKAAKPEAEISQMIPGAPPRPAAKAATMCRPRSAASRRTVSSHQKAGRKGGEHSHGGR